MRIEGTTAQIPMWTDGTDQLESYASRATTADLINCPETGYVGAVLEPAILDLLPEPTSTAGKVVNNLTNVYDLFDAINTDICVRGRLGKESASASVDSIARSFTSLVTGLGTVKLAALGSLFGPAGTAAGIGTGVFLLKVAPPLAGQLGRASVDFFANLIDRTKEYLDQVRR